MAYNAWFQCINGCPGEFDLREVIYRCPTCGEYLQFRTDRNGRMMEYCACGHRAFVERRTGKREEPQP